MPYITSNYFRRGGYFTRCKYIKVKLLYSFVYINLCRKFFVSSR